DWVSQASGAATHRAVIYLLSDGRTEPKDEPTGLEQKQLINDFNAANKARGVIRLATVGYFQKPPGQDEREDAARQLLKSLPLNPGAYFEAKNAEVIAGYVKRTISID